MVVRQEEFVMILLGALESTKMMRECKSLLGFLFEEREKYVDKMRR